MGGFLGSGKTTVLIQLARYLTGRSPKKEAAVVIIENEIGKVGIDNQILSYQGMEVKNLFSGCVCCSISGELESTIASILRQFDPEYIILEATGVAHPRQIRDNLKRDMDLDCKILCLADASRWLRLLVPMQAVMPMQLEGADVILINKVDLVENPETLEAVRNSIHAFNETAQYFETTTLSPLEPEIFRVLLEVV